MILILKLEPGYYATERNNILTTRNCPLIQIANILLLMNMI
jgi:hypothetical protein